MHQRLDSLFETIDLRELNRLDLVVLTKDESVGQFAPPDSEFAPMFENRLFRLETANSRRQPRTQRDAGTDPEVAVATARPP